MLPKIACFFDTTIDALIGRCEYHEEEEVNKIQEELRKYDSSRDEASLVKCAEDALKEFPNNYLLMAWIVYGSQNINPKRSIELGEYVLANCRNSHILNWVRTELCYAYFKNGDRTTAISSARDLPSPLQTRDSVLTDLTDGSEQAKHILQNVVAKFGYNFKCTMTKLMPHYDPLSQIELLKKSNSVYDAIYENDDCVEALYGKVENFRRIAEIYLNIGLKAEAVKYMNEALKYAEKHDAIQYGSYPASILCRCDKYDYKVQISGTLAHPYGKLKEALISSFKSNAIFAEELK